MKIAYNWLKDYIVLEETPEEIAHLLTQSGLEVSNVSLFESIQGSLRGLVLGKILACQKHPHADKLQYTQVDIGNNTLLWIVCGAYNLQVGQQVIVAPVGTTIYSYAGESVTIKQAKIRGLVSEGMICAAYEIGLNPNNQDILVLNTAFTPGTPASQCLAVTSDTVLTIDLTPNRADACSHMGVARELRALLNRPLQLPIVASLPTDGPSFPMQVTIEDAANCPRYTGVLIQHVSIQASPAWLQNKLKAIGIHPINNVVDITNFVMYELGQPLHAFDYDQIVGKTLQVRKARVGEPFVSLDGITSAFIGQELVVSDQEGAIAIAGVLVGKRTNIHPNTQNIYLESAYFAPQAIRKTMQCQKIRTDTGFRYERGTDPHITVYALQRALDLIQQIAPQATCSKILDLYPQPITPLQIKVYYQNINKLIGQVIPQGTIKNLLSNLDIGFKDEKPDSFISLVPSYRVDVTREIDIIEEILRIYGYEQIQVSNHLSSDFLAASSPSLPYKTVYTLSVLLTAHGYYEICTNSLTASAHTKLAGTADEKHTIAILNPLSERLDSLRQILVASGLEVIAHNINRQQNNLKFFEFGKTYHQLESQYVENNQLGLWLTGNLEAPTWIRKPQAVTFQDLQAIINQLLCKLGIKDFTRNPFTNAVYQAGLQMQFGQQTFATAGQLNQTYLQKMGIKQPVFFAELNWDLLSKQPNALLACQPLAKFPLVKRDLSLVLDQAITFEQIKNLLKQQEEPFIQDITVFDVYQDLSLADGKKAYALSFALQDKEKTLEEKTIQQVMQRLMQVFETQLGAIIRE